MDEDGRKGWIFRKLSPLHEYISLSFLLRTGFDSVTYSDEGGRKVSRALLFRLCLPPFIGENFSMNKKIFAEIYE